MKVELIYDAGCPNVVAARARLTEAFASIGRTPQWAEWQRGDDRAPTYVRRYGSPTILVEGEDVAPEAPIAGTGACRLYADSSGRWSGLPALLDIRAALVRTGTADPASMRSLKRTVPALPAIGFALLPKLTCAACWPAYTALLASFGIGFIDYTPYLLPLMTVGIALTLILLAYKATMRRGYGPLVLGVVAGAAILGGKFLLDSDVALYGGIGLLVAASLWNAWPVHVTAPCQACESNPDRPAGLT